MIAPFRATAAAVAALLLACTPDSPTSPTEPSFSAFGLEAPAMRTTMGPTILTVPTYDGSGEAVHPDVLWFPDKWHGFEYWMAFTPYPHGRERFENPSIVVSHDGQRWEVPPGLTNPVVPWPRGSSYNSDPDLSYDAAADALVMISREVRGGFNVVKLQRSQNGTSWTPPRTILRRRNHGIISPALILSAGGSPSLWYVDGGPKSCPKRTTRVMRQNAASAEALRTTPTAAGWSIPVPAGLEQPGYWIWHIDITWVSERGEYWALYPAYPRSGCGARDLFFARSRDGRTWTTYPAPLLRHEDERWTSAMLYRASALYDAPRGMMRVFLSAAAPGPEWRLGYAEFSLDDVLAAVSGPARGHAVRGPAGRRAAPPIPDDELP